MPRARRAGFLNALFSSTDISNGMLLSSPMFPKASTAGNPVQVSPPSIISTRAFNAEGSFMEPRCSMAEATTFLSVSLRALMSMGTVLLSFTSPAMSTMNLRTSTLSVSYAVTRCALASWPRRIKASMAELRAPASSSSYKSSSMLSRNSEGLKLAIRVSTQALRTRQLGSLSAPTRADTASCLDRPSTGFASMTTVSLRTFSSTEARSFLISSFKRLFYPSSYCALSPGASLLRMKVSGPYREQRSHHRPSRITLRDTSASARGT